MSFTTALLVLASLSSVLFLLWPLVPVKPKPRWVNFLPLFSLGVLIVQVLTGGFQVALLGAYLFNLILFLTNLRGLQRGGSQPQRRGWAIARGLVGVALLAFCLVPAVLLPTDFETAQPAGPYAIGTVTYGWEDTARMEEFTPEDPADHRKIVVQLWYPVDAGQEHPRSGEAVENAPVSTASAQFPLLVFSHGAFGVRSSNTTTYLELASQGYIVASIDHAYHAFFTRFPDGSSAVISQQFLADLQRNQSGEATEAENFEMSFNWMDLRTADIRFTLDQIEALNAGQSQNPLAGRIDLEKIGLFGHSLGGAASAAACREDPRCKAVAVIDSTMFGEYRRDLSDGSLVDEPFPAPLMIFYNGDTYHATVDHLGYVPDLHAFENASAPAYSVVVNGAQHLNFTDLPARAPALARLLGSMMTVNGGTTGEISQDRCMAILNHYVLDFFNQALLEKPSPLLGGESPYQEVEFTASAK